MASSLSLSLLMLRSSLLQVRIFHILLAQLILINSMFHSGYGGVTIWDVKSSTPVPSPHLPYNHQNPKHTYSASIWLYFEGIDKHVLVVGNMAGEIFLWTWDRTQKVCSYFILVTLYLTVSRPSVRLALKWFLTALIIK